MQTNELEIPAKVAADESQPDSPAPEQDPATGEEAGIYEAGLAQRQAASPEIYQRGDGGSAWLPQERHCTVEESAQSAKQQGGRE